MGVIAVAILASSGAPVFYAQERVGRGGRPFRMWKFRSMVVDAEAETGPVWASADDPRRTRVGRFLRTTSLDELPQLWNVLRGDMGIVGPRPERPAFVDGFSDTLPTYAHRHRIRPGITGLAQVRGLRGDTALEPRVDADNRYIEHWSMGLDLAIALRTLVEVIRHRNAG
jgi:lipopolysaccharide/colanic/teichoic acid biosynthesis glycosyltransferase